MYALRAKLTVTAGTSSGSSRMVNVASLSPPRVTPATLPIASLTLSPSSSTSSSAAVKVSNLLLSSLANVRDRLGGSIA